MRRDDHESDRDAEFLREAEQEQGEGRKRRPGDHEVVRDRQAAHLRERLRDADENVTDLPDDASDA